MHFKEGKTPGVDGFSATFYQTYWETVGPMLLEAYYEGYNKWELHLSARRGVLSLIPKKERNVLLIKNWRPLTMLTLDYKILSKALDNRLKGTVLNHIIEPYQTGFMEGRNILTNIIKLLSIMNETTRKQILGLILSIDFEKCFDMIEHCAIRGALQYFGVGPKYIRWIMLLFTNFEVCTQNNGNVSKWINPTRGLHQGCCISPHLMLITGQLFADMFEENKEIKGIELQNIINLLSQFADDTNVYLDANTNFAAVTQTLQKAERNLGLKVNYDKTVLYRIGSLQHAQAERYVQETYTWGEPPITTLGVDVINDPIEMAVANMQPLIGKVESVLNAWKHRNLTLMGWVLVVNTLVESLFVYKMSVLSHMDDSILNQIQQIIWTYIWQGKHAKINFSLLRRPKDHGGLCLVDLRSKHQALLIQWIFNVDMDNYLQSALYSSIAPVLGRDIWLINAKESDIQTWLHDSFWRSVLIAWTKYSHVYPTTY